MAQFEYNMEILPQGLLDIEDIGNCAIEAKTEEEIYFYIVIKTSLGTTSVFTSGPVIPDIALLPNGYNCSLVRFPYKESKIIGEINKFLNNLIYNKKHIIEAVVIDEETALEQFRDMANYISSYGEELY